MKSDDKDRRWEVDRLRTWLRWDDYLLLRNLFVKGHFRVFDDAMWEAVLAVTRRDRDVFEECDLLN